MFQNCLSTQTFCAQVVLRTHLDVLAGLLSCIDVLGPSVREHSDRTLAFGEVYLGVFVLGQGSLKHTVCPFETWLLPPK